MNDAVSPDQFRERALEHLRELNDILRKIAARDFTVTIPVLDEKDEFAELYFGIQLMINDLQDTFNKQSSYSKELENEVKKHTTELESKVKELETVNKMMVGRELKMVELKKQIEELQTKLDSSTHK